MAVKKSNRLRGFHKDESGAAIVEFMLMVPIIAWTLLSTLVYFDAYRAEAASTRAGLTIADMISREDSPVTPDYLDSAQKLLQFLTLADETPELRVSVYQWVEDDDQFRIRWSRTRDWAGDEELDDTSINLLSDRLPEIVDGERAVLVETKTEYTPPFRIDLGLRNFQVGDVKNVEFTAFTVISPRFLPSICWREDVNDEEGENDIC